MNHTPSILQHVQVLVALHDPAIFTRIPLSRFVLVFVQLRCLKNALLI